jgi:diguanylate cyclase (GGDEF)-like protein
MSKKLFFRTCTVFSSGVGAASLAFWAARSSFYNIDPQAMFASTGTVVTGLAALAGAGCAHAYFAGGDEQASHFDKALRTDNVTGLLSRFGLEKAVKELIKKADTGKSLDCFYLISMDFDELKLINNVYGTEAGNAVLKVLADRLSSIVGDAGPLARTNGSEFVIALKVGHDKRELQAAVEALLDALSKPVRINTTSYPVYASGGIAELKAGDGTLEKVLRHANLARANAKQSGRGSYTIYHPEMSHQASYNQWLESELSYALQRDEFRLAYQPQYDLNSGALTGYEALLRWTHREKGAISPADFISVAENCGLIQEIGTWVLRRACFDATHLQPDVKMAVNVSTVQLENPKFIDTLKSILIESGLPATRLELEITENNLIKDHIRMRRLFKELNQMGVAIAIDDFGTGYSNLTNLSELCFDKIKIDKSFVDRLDQNKNKNLMITTIINLGHSLGARVIAEGIENEAQANLLKDAGCNLVQGYYFGKPLSFSEAETLKTNPLTIEQAA